MQYVFFRNKTALTICLCCTDSYWTTNTAEFALLLTTHDAIYMMLPLVICLQNIVFLEDVISEVSSSEVCLFKSCDLKMKALCLINSTLAFFGKEYIIYNLKYNTNNL